MDKNGKLKYSLLTVLYYVVGILGAIILYGLLMGLGGFERAGAAATFICLCVGVFVFVTKISMRYKGVGKGLPISTVVDLLPFEIVFGLACIGVLITMSIAVSLLNFGVWDDFVIPVYASAGILFSLDILTGTIAARAAEKRFKDSLLTVKIVRFIFRQIAAFCRAFPGLTAIEKICAAAMVIQVIALLFVVSDVCAYVELGFLLILLTSALDTFILIAFFQMRSVKKNLQSVAKGDYDSTSEIKHMLPQIKEYAAVIDDIGEGQKIVAERLVKSERMKTELITNVSHDLRTPLTSIVNYVDLLDRENLESKKAKEYIEVLKRQSAKLKKLTEDLIEVSKAASGNIEMNLEDCDVSVLIGQAEGEFSDKFKAKDLKLEISGTDKPVNVVADGRYLWRVFDNLLSNISKYAMPGSRVYIDVEKNADHTSVIFKNISEKKLNISADELMERFVRGDESRSTEGSGLGLSIADSIMKMMKGELIITVDGDLFKAECRF